MLYCLLILYKYQYTVTLCMARFNGNTEITSQLQSARAMYKRLPPMFAVMVPSRHTHLSYCISSSEDACSYRKWYIPNDIFGLAVIQRQKKMGSLFRWALAFSSGVGSPGFTGVTTVSDGRTLVGLTCPFRTLVEDLREPFEKAVFVFS